MFEMHGCVNEANMKFLRKAAYTLNLYVLGTHVIKQLQHVNGCLSLDLYV